MRKSWRAIILVLLAAIWPQLGCLQVPADKSVQDLRPIQQKVGSAPRQELTAMEIGQSLSAQAAALENARKASEAIAMYEKIRSTDPSQALQATKKIAILHLRSNDLDRAEQEYQLLWQNNPKDADTLCALGDISYRRGHWGIAEKLFRDAVSRQPDHTHALVNLGMTLAQQAQDEKRYGESIEMLKKVVSEAEAYCTVALVMNANGKPEDALRAFQTALSRQPGLQRARDGMAQLYKNDPSLAVRVTTPFKMEKRGVVDLEPSPFLASEGNGRSMMQRPTLPPSPDFDLAEGNGRDWQSSGKKK